MTLAIPDCTFMTISIAVVEEKWPFLISGQTLGDCSHELKTCLLLGRKAMTNLDWVLKSRDITLPTKVHIVKDEVFPGVMYGYESCTIKKAEGQKIDAFELWCWIRLLRNSWTARRSKQSILKEINPEYSLEGLLLKLKLQYFGHMVRRADSLEKTLMLGKIEGRRESGWMRWLDSTINSTHEFQQTLRGREGQGSPTCCNSWVTKSQTQLNDLTTATATRI